LPCQLYGQNIPIHPSVLYLTFSSLLLRFIRLWARLSKYVVKTADNQRRVRPFVHFVDCLIMIKL
jgi:hypothetical protein